MPKGDDRDRVKRLGKHQRGILLWLAKAEGVEPKPDELVVVGDVTFTSLLAEAVWKQWGALTELAEAAKERDDYNRRRRKGTPWRSSDYLGRRPTDNERKAINRALAELDERKLIFRHNRAGEGKRTSHVALTSFGETIALWLMQKSRQSRGKSRQSGKEVDNPEKK